MATAEKVLVGVVILAVGLAYWQGRKAGAAKAELTPLKARIDSLSSANKELGERFRVDTVKVFRRITNTDTLLQQLIDTAVVLKTDTVKVTVEVLKENLETLRACRVLVSDCAEGWNREKQITVDLRKEVDLMKKLQPSFVERWVWRIAAFELGRISAGRVP